MKNIYIGLLFFSLQILSSGIAFAQTNTFPTTGAAGIGTLSPNGSSLLEVTSTTKGILFPRMTKAQRDLILSPVQGLLIYQTNSTQGFYYYDGSAWTAVTSKGANKSLGNLTGPTAINESLLPATTNTIDLGSSTFLWRNAWFSGDAKINDVTIGRGGSATQSNTALGFSALSANVSGIYSTASGYGTLFSNTTGSFNTAIGYKSLYFSTTASYNTAGGYAALYNNITGSYNTAYGAYAMLVNNSGNYNTATGFKALYNNTSGSDNVAIGIAALFSNTIGNKNTACGDSALYSNTTGVSNTANGYRALYSNTSASENTATGRSALYSNTTGTENTAHGYNTLYSNTTGNFNTATGSYALIGNSTGSSNTVIGYSAMNSNTTGNYNTASGVLALYSNTTGYENSANGYRALYSNTTGIYNTAEGSHALYKNSTGFSNTAHGYNALYSNTTAEENSAIGSSTLYSNTTGFYNTATGFNALYSNTSGSGNTANGHSAMYSNTIGDENIAVGFNALYNNTTGDNNTAIGNGALYGSDVGTNNTACGKSAGFGILGNTNCTCLGYDAGQTASTSFSNSMALGNGSRMTATNQVRIGNSIVGSIGGFAGWSNVSDGRYKKDIKENVPGLAFINKLKPVTYHLDVTGLQEFLGETRTGNEDKGLAKRTEKEKVQLQSDAKMKEQIIYSGFVAQEVEQSAREAGYDFSGVDAPKNDKDLYGLRYADFVVPLVKAVQELSMQDDGLKTEDERQNAELENLKKENEDLKAEIENLKLSIDVQQPSMANGFVKLPTENCKPEALLGQNIPNPFDHSTLIPFRIPKNCTDASIMITNTSTSQVISLIPISCNEDHVSIDSGVLASGTYAYTLYVDGKVVDTKKMVLAR